MERACVKQVRYATIVEQHHNFLLIVRGTQRTFGMVPFFLIFAVQFNGAATKHEYFVVVSLLKALFVNIHLQLASLTFHLDKCISFTMNWIKYLENIK